MLTRLELKQITTAIDGMTKYTNGEMMIQKTHLLNLIATFTEDLPVPQEVPQKKVEAPKKTKNIDKSKEFSRKTIIGAKDTKFAGYEDVYQAEDDFDEDDCEVCLEESEY